MFYGVFVSPPDAMNLCLSLITQGLEDTAFYILKTFPTLQSDRLNSESPNVGNFFLRHCVTMDTVSNILLVCLSFILIPC